MCDKVIFTPGICVCAHLTQICRRAEKVRRNEEKIMKKATKVMALATAMVLLACTLTACGSSAKGGKITFGTNAEFPPFEYVTSEGVIDQYDGIDMAIAKSIAEQNDMTVVVENMEFDSLLVALQNGHVDAVIAGMTATDERRGTVDFSTPYYTATQVMIVKEDSDIASAADMADKKICVVQGYTGEVCVNDMGYPYEAFKKGTEAVMELVNGKCDVVVIDSATAQKYVSDNEGLKIVQVCCGCDCGVAVSTHVAKIRRHQCRNRAHLS